MINMVLKTVCLTLMCLPSIYSQSLYENDFQQYSAFNKESRDSSVQILLEEKWTDLNNKILDLQYCNDRKNSSLEVYKSFLRTYNKRLVPNDETIDEICTRHPDLIVGSVKDCHRYYNCSGEDTELGKFWSSKHKHECFYPFLFSEGTMQCENYTNVKCGPRFKPTWECRYFRLKCKIGPCKPCETVYPSCEFKPDGIWPSPDNPYHSDYIKCEQGRRIEKGRCPIDAEWATVSYPYEGRCVSLFAVPTEYNPNGELPSCTGKEDGNHPYLVGYCPGYYKCEGGVATAVKCPKGTMFDAVRKICMFGGKCIL